MFIIINGFLIILVLSVYGFQPFSFVLILLFFILTAIAFCDLEKRLIPNRLLSCLLVLTPFYLWLEPFETSFAEHATGFFAVSVPMLLIAVFTSGFGGGDIKLMAVCGLMIGTRLILVSIALAICYAAVGCILLLSLKKAGRKTAIFFGPFLSGGLISALLFGTDILCWYLS